MDSETYTKVSRRSKRRVRNAKSSNLHTKPPSCDNDVTKLQLQVSTLKEVIGILRNEQKADKQLTKELTSELNAIKNTLGSMKSKGRTAKHFKKLYKFNQQSSKRLRGLEKEVNDLNDAVTTMQSEEACSSTSSSESCSGGDECKQSGGAVCFPLKPKPPPTAPGSPTNSTESSAQESTEEANDNETTSEKEPN